MRNWDAHFISIKAETEDKTHNTGHIIEQKYQEEVTVLNVCNTKQGKYSIKCFYQPALF